MVVENSVLTLQNCIYIIFQRMSPLLTFHMRKSTKYAARTVSSLLYIVAFCRLVDFRMKLLFSASVTVLAIVTGLTVARLAPLLAVLDIGAWSRSAKATYKCNNMYSHSKLAKQTCICTSWASDVYPCCCGIVDRHSPGDIVAADACTARFCSWLAHSWCLAIWDPRS